MACINNIIKVEISFLAIVITQAKPFKNSFAKKKRRIVNSDEIHTFASLKFLQFNESLGVSWS